MIKTIATEKAPAAVGPYSQGKIVGGILYCAGQGGIDPAVGKIVEGGVQAEAEQACKNVGALLEEAGTSFDNVVEVTCFLADIADFGAFNEIYAKYFTNKRKNMRCSQRSAAGYALRDQSHRSCRIVLTSGSMLHNRLMIY